uniref:Uncharacterized protein n=1 Tax=Panagrellus redivivus TaxID=6233 RepID=A0A7E4W2N1_PANRE
MGSFYSLCFGFLLLYRISAEIPSKYFKPTKAWQLPSEMRKVLHGDSVDVFHGTETPVPFDIEIHRSLLLVLKVCFNESSNCINEKQEIIFCYRSKSTHKVCEKPEKIDDDDDDNEDDVCGVGRNGFRFRRTNASIDATAIELLGGTRYEFTAKRCAQYTFLPNQDSDTTGVKVDSSPDTYNVCNMDATKTVTAFFQLEVALVAAGGDCRATLEFMNANMILPGSFVPTTTTTEGTTTTEIVTIPPELEAFNDSKNVSEGSLSKRWWIFLIVGIVVLIIVVVLVIGLKWRCIHDRVRGPFRRRIKVTAPVPSTSVNPQVSEETKLPTEGTSVATENVKNAKPAEEAKESPKPNPEVVVVKAAADNDKKPAPAPAEPKKEASKPVEKPASAAPAVEKSPKPKPAAPESNKKPPSSLAAETAMLMPDRKGVVPTKSCYQRSMRAVTAKPIEPPLPLNKTQSFSENEMTADELEYLAFCTSDPGKRFRIFRAAVKTAEKVAETHGYFLNARDPTVPEEEDTWLRVGADNLIKTCIELHGEPLPAIGDSHNEHMEFVATHSMREIYQVALYVELDDATRMYFLQAVIERFKELLKKFPLEELEKCKHPMSLLIQVYKEHPEAFVTKASRNAK